MNANDGILDAILVPLGLLILLSYQFFWFWRVRYTPLLTVLGVNHLARRYWVESIMKVRKSVHSVISYLWVQLAVFT
jgi:hypothetical protein